MSGCGNRERWVNGMQDTYYTSPNMVVLLGTALLIGSLYPVCRLVVELPAGEVRRQWRLLGAMIVCVIGGYITYAIGGAETNVILKGLLVPLVLFLGGCFVLAVAMMSLRTAHDVRRMSVLERETVTDPLTGLYNRRYLDNRIKEEVARAQRHVIPLSLLLIDIDHFKQVNDQWGHPVGDDALAALGRLLSGAVRTEDVVARYGGEEIAIIALNSAAPVAAVLAERLCRTVEHTVLVSGAGTSERAEVRLTISVGVATLQGQADDAKRLTCRADAALYEAKSEGRNRVAVSRAQENSR